MPLQKKTGSFWGFCRLSGAAPALEGTTVRLSSSPTLHRAPEGSESRWIVTRRRPREPLTLSCEPIGDRVTVLREPWDSDRGPLEWHRRTQPRDLDQVSYSVNESDDQEDMKCNPNIKIQNIKATSYYHIIKHSDTDPGLVICSTMAGTVNLVIIKVGCEVKKKKEKEKEKEKCCS